MRRPLLCLSSITKKVSSSDSDSVLLASNLAVERKIPKKKRPKSSSPVFVHNEKRDRGIKNLADLKPLCLSFSLTEDSSLFFLSLCPCLGLCCTVGGQAGGGGRGGAVRTPCPALSSSGWPVPSGRWASRSDRPLRESSRQEMERDRRSQILFIRLNFYPDFSLVTLTDGEGLTCKYTSDNGTNPR